MLPKKKTLIPRTRADRVGSNLTKADAYVLGPKDYDEIPQLTAEWFRRAVPHFGGVPIRGPGTRVKIDQASRKAGTLPRVPRKKVR
jgi:hypothetical protein